MRWWFSTPTVWVAGPGLSVLDSSDNKEFYDPEANFAWLNTLKGLLKPGIEVKEVDVHVTEGSFGDVAAEMFYDMMRE
jgi:uncharacterized protein (UPF0261 family)